MPTYLTQCVIKKKKREKIPISWVALQKVNKGMFNKKIMNNSAV